MKGRMIKWFIPLTIVLALVMGFAMVGTGVYAVTHDWSGTASMNVQCGGVDVSLNYLQQGTVTGGNWALGDVARGGTYVAEWRVTNNGCEEITVTPSLGYMSTGITADWDKGATVIAYGYSATFALTVHIASDCTGGSATVDYYLDW